MCYDIKVSLERQLKVAKHYGDKAVIEQLEKQLFPLLNPIEREFYQVSGFDHPRLFVLQNSGIELSKWGLIPNWIKSREDANEIINKTLNARVESVMEKPSFRDAFNSGRGVLFVDGFYEHKHVNGKAYPHYIQDVKSKELALACIVDHWTSSASSSQS